MKLDPARIEPFLKNPGSAPAVLVFGKDPGLVAARGLALARAVLGEKTADPFLFAELRDPAPDALLAEATAGSLLGGRRVIRVREAGEALAKPLEALLRAPPDALVILEAGDLTPKSKLRALAEKSTTAAAIPCYALDAKAVPRMLADRLRAQGKTIDADAARWVSEHIAPEEGPLAAAVELLVLYAGTEPRLGLEDVAAALAEGGDVSVLDAVDAALTGDAASADRALELAFQEGQSPVGIVRVLLMELMRLRVAVASGLAPGQAVAAMRPPVFFKRQPIVTKALGLWREAALTEAIRQALAAEAACKTTHVPDQDYCRQMLLGFCSRARAAARR